MPHTANPIALYDCRLLVGGLCLSHQVAIATMLVIFVLLATFVRLVRPTGRKNTPPTTSTIGPTAPVDLLATVHEEAAAIEEDQEEDEFVYGTPHEMIQRPVADAEATASDHNKIFTGEEEEEYAYDAFFSIPSSAEGTPDQSNANEGHFPSSSPSSSKSQSPRSSPASSSSSSRRRAPCPRCRRPFHLPCFHSTDADGRRLTSPKLNFRGEKVTDPYACNYCGLPTHFFNQCPHRVV